MARVLAVSAGHGSKISGMVKPYLDEHPEARKVCTAVVEILRRAGATVRGPFFDDTSTSQNQNLETIVRWHNSQQRDLDVSIHFNANNQTSSPMGCEVLYVTQESLARQVSAAIAAAGHFKDRGPKYRSDLFFLNNTAKPAILIETCFGDSSADVNLYRANFTAICEAIARTAAGERPPGERPPPVPERPLIGKGDSGPYVESVQKSLGLPADGDFGSVTDAGVRAFQRAWAVPGGADGLVGDNTWAALDILDARMTAGDDGIPAALASRIEALASGAVALQNFYWDDRGEAPPGYYAGMGQAFALALLRLAAGDDGAEIMAAADSHEPNTDALSFYADEFRDAGMSNNRDGPETLRHLFVMMVGLGMRESSGDHWVGRDMSASNVDSDTCEAGLFQTSWNINTAATAEMGALLVEFKADPNGFRPTFTRGTSPSAADLDCYGSGNGVLYQWLAKYSPAFAVLTTGIGMRRRRQHWGPIGRREVQLVDLVDGFLAQVQEAVEQSRSVA